MQDDLDISYAQLFIAYAQEDPSRWKIAIGQKVTHTTFGIGTIKSADCSHLEVCFVNDQQTSRKFKSEYLAKPQFFSNVQLPNNLEGIEITKERLRAKSCQEFQQRLNKEIVRIAKKYKLTQLKADELYQLLEEMRPLNFTCSKKLSKYIVEHKLGYKYPNISGIVRMEEADTQWDFYGGFPPDIYKIICTELDLDNQGTSARPVGFTPFKSSFKENNHSQP